MIEQLENGQLLGFEFVKSICQSPNVFSPPSFNAYNA